MTKYYVLPFLLYVVGTSIAAQVPSHLYPLSYTAVAVIVAISLTISLPKVWDIRPHWQVLPAIAVGIFGIAVWVGICQLHLESLITDYMPTFLKPTRAAFNPFDTLGNGAAAWSFIGVRIIGIAILVPLLEEVFWRAFLLRWFIDENWTTIPLGKFTLGSCALVTLLFSLAHPEWLAAIMYCLLLNFLLYWRRDLWSCIVAHSVSNLLLAIYVLTTGNWWLW